MEFVIFLIAVSSLFGFVIGRGPHHPRSERRHVHTKPNDKLTRDSEVLHDKVHIEEHLEKVIPKPDLSKMTNEELELYYFMLHDSDKNSKLDGLEILNAILHTTHEDNNEETNSDSNDISQEIVSLDPFIELVDKVLDEDDENHDGYLSYAEYVKARHDLKDSQPSVQILK